jgi:dihydroflavonol-4-reductase
MRVAVTGASGHLGAAVVRRLLEGGARVRVVVRRDGRAVDGLDVERCSGDLFDPASLERVFDGVEAVFHAAGRISIAGDPDGEVHRTNVVGTRNVVAACLAAGVRRLVHFSSIHAFADPGPGHTLDETGAPADPRRAPAYDRSKVAGQLEVEAAQERGLEAVILHPAACMGPYDFKPSRMGRVLLDLAAGRVPALVDGGFVWVDTRDVAAAAAAAARTAPSGSHYLLTGRWRSVREVAEIVAAEGGARAPRGVCPLPQARAAAPLAEAVARMRRKEPLFTSESLRAIAGHRDVSHRRAAADLGFAPRPLEETIADSLAWFRAAGVS